VKKFRNIPNFVPFREFTILPSVYRAVITIVFIAVPWVEPANKFVKIRNVTKSVTWFVLPIKPCTKRNIAPTEKLLKVRVRLLTDV
jgi:hypothetical protein